MDAYLKLATDPNYNKESVQIIESLRNASKGPHHIGSPIAPYDKARHINVAITADCFDFETMTLTSRHLNLS